MTKAQTILSFTTAAALLVSACSSDSGSSDAATWPTAPLGDGAAMGPNGQTMSPVGAGSSVQDAGMQTSTGPSSTTGDASSPGSIRNDAGVEAGAGADAGVDASVEAGALDAGMTGADGSRDAAQASADPDFDMCYAMVKPNCVAKEMNTAELMQTPCKSLTNIPIPLTDGGTYGPVTMDAGPYGGKVEWNQGKGTQFANEVNLAEEICVPIGIDTFNEPKSVNDEIKNLRGVDWSLYTIFRPACFKKGEKYPVITWANGTCGEIAGYSSLLSTLASHGFVVIAANSTWTATPPTDNVQLRALDFAKALNEDPKSIFYQKLDMDHIGAMGHSQGAAATGNADGDQRIKAVIFWNSGTSNEKPFLNISGERDIGNSITPQTMASGVNAATQPGGWVFYRKVLQTGGTSTGHLTLMEQPERVIDLTVAWWRWQLKGDEEAKKMFVGADCGLCKTPEELEYGHNSLLK